MAHRAIFLDRDGIINQMVYNPEFGVVDSPANPDEFELIPGIGETISGFNLLGFLVVIVSNQPGIAKGKLCSDLLEQITNKMLSGIETAGGKIHAVYYCLHHPQAVHSEYRQDCECRKPKAGLILKAANELEIDLSKSYMIGDGITDMLAGKAAGVRSIFVNSRKCYLCDEMTTRGAKPDYGAITMNQAFEIVRLLDNGDERSASKYCISGERMISTEG